MSPSGPLPFPLLRPRPAATEPAHTHLHSSGITFASHSLHFGAIADWWNSLSTPGRPKKKFACCSTIPQHMVPSQLRSRHYDVSQLTASEGEAEGGGGGDLHHWFFICMVRRELNRVSSELPRPSWYARHIGRRLQASTLAVFADTNWTDVCTTTLRKAKISNDQTHRWEPCEGMKGPTCGKDIWPDKNNRSN